MPREKGLNSFTWRRRFLSLFPMCPALPHAFCPTGHSITAVAPCTEQRPPPSLPGACTVDPASLGGNETGPPSFTMSVPRSAAQAAEMPLARSPTSTAPPSAENAAAPNAGSPRASSSPGRKKGLLSSLSTRFFPETSPKKAPSPSESRTVLQQGGDWSATAAAAVAANEPAALRHALQESPSAVRAADPEGGSTLLHLAASLGHADIVEMLLQLGAGAEPLQRDMAGNTALHVAAMAGASGVIAALGAALDPELVADEDRNAAGLTPLMAAAAGGKAIALRALLEAFPQADPLAHTDTGATALHLAAERGFNDVLQVLVRQGKAFVDAVDDAGATPLHVAASAGQARTLYHLVSRLGAGLNSTDSQRCTALHRAWSGKHVEAVQVLLQLGAKALPRGGGGGSAPSRGGATLLHMAAAEPSFWSIVPTLVTACGLRPSAVDAAGRTPLHIAAEVGNFDTLTYLLGVGANPSARDPQGATPVHLAAAQGRYACVAYLVSAHSGAASINARDARGRTPLHWAVVTAAGAPLTAKLITAHGADVHAADVDGDTPLHAAVRAGEGGAVSTLMARGANPFLLNDMGESPWSLCDMEVSGRLIRMQRLTAWGLLGSLLLTVVLNYVDVISDVLVAAEMVRQNNPIFFTLVVSCVSFTAVMAAVVAYKGRIPDGTRCEKVTIASVAFLQLLPALEFFLDLVSLGTRVPLFQDRIRDHRFAEVVFESTPQALLQVFIVLSSLAQAEVVAGVQYLSIALSILSLTVFYVLFLDIRANGITNAVTFVAWSMRTLLVASRIGSLVVLSLLTRNVYGIIPALVADVLLATGVTTWWTGRVQWQAWRHTFGWQAPFPATVLIPQSSIYRVLTTRVVLDCALAGVTAVVAVATPGVHLAWYIVALFAVVGLAVGYTLALGLLPRMLPQRGSPFWTPPPTGTHVVSVDSVEGSSRRGAHKRNLYLSHRTLALAPAGAKGGTSTVTDASSVGASQSPTQSLRGDDPLPMRPPHLALLATGSAPSTTTTASQHSQSSPLALAAAQSDSDSSDSSDSAFPPTHNQRPSAVRRSQSDQGTPTTSAFAHASATGVGAPASPSREGIPRSASLSHSRGHLPKRRLSPVRRSANAAGRTARHIPSRAARNPMLTTAKPFSAHTGRDFHRRISLLMSEHATRSEDSFADEYSPKPRGGTAPHRMARGSVSALSFNLHRRSSALPSSPVSPAALR